MSDDDSHGDELFDCEEKKEGGFRFQARRVFLTYSQTGGKISDYAQIIEGIRERLPGEVRINRWVISLEHHADGGEHFHCYFQFTSKLNSRDERLFDVRGCHPNIKRVQDEKRVIAYIIKQGQYWEDRLDMVLYPTWDGYVRKKADFEAWILDKQRAGVKEVVWPVLLPGIGEWERIDGRKRHLCVIGPYGWGKTTIVQNAFRGCRVYMRPQGADTPPFECYRDEEVIIYDDVVPKYEELVAVSNVWHVPVAVYGKVRYTNRFWKLGQQRRILLLLNQLPEYGDRMEGFHSRFKLIEILPAVPVEHVENGCPI